MAIQQDFGGFDPSFLGVTLRFASQHSWRIYQDLVESPRPLPLPSSYSVEEMFETLSVTSVVSHEVRHFHDFFLTPYSAYVFRLRIQLLLNIFELLPFIVEGDENCNCLLVPISTWCLLNGTERNEQLDKLPQRTDGKPWVPVEIAYLDQQTLDFKPADRVLLTSSGEPLKKLLAAAIRGRSKIHDLTYNPQTVSEKASFQPWQIFELSGLLIQMQEIWHSYGARETECFTNYLVRSRTPYGGILRATWQMWSSMHRHLDPNLTSAIVMWSLAGSYELDVWEACPTFRFVKVWTHIRKSGISTKGGGLNGLFKEWSMATKLSTVDDGLNDAVKQFRSARDAVEKCMQVKDSFAGENYCPFLFRVLNGVVKACEHMTKQVRENPELYVYPNLYLDSVAKFPNPVMRISADGGYLRSDRSGEAAEPPGHIVEWAIGDESSVASMIVPYRLSDFVFFDAEDVHELALMMELTDFLFGDRARARTNIQRAGRAWFSNGSLRPIEILR